MNNLKRAFFYCEFCHADISDLDKIKKCKCHRGNFNFFCKFFLQNIYKKKSEPESIILDTDGVLKKKIQFSPTHPPFL